MFPVSPQQQFSECCRGHAKHCCLLADDLADAVRPNLAPLSLVFCSFSIVPLHHLFVLKLLQRPWRM